MKKIYALFGLFGIMTACASEPNMDDWSAEEIYNKAFDDLEATKYKKAAEEFEKVETEHPYSKWAVKSKLMSAYAYYKNEKYDEAIMAADRFLKYHPGNKDAAYALYLKGICYYDQISAADKDQGDTQKAEEAFAYLIALFPNTPYAEDARNKINLTEDYKAGQEMVVGRFYLNDGNYLSALNRFNVVLENYQTTIQIEEALYREVEIYAIFGMKEYANGYYKILKQNYPDGKWTAKAAKIMERLGEKAVKSDDKKYDAVEENKEHRYNERKEQKVSKQETSKTDNNESVKDNNKSWFSGWFGGDDKVETTNNAVVADESAKDNNKSWFSGWFSGDDKVETTNDAVVANESVKDDNKSWFSGWFSGDDKAEVETVTPLVENTAIEVSEDDNRITVASKEESKSWFSGWFGAK